jgi:hypothetical protein
MDAWEAKARYWCARLEFERVLKETPPEALELTSDDVEQMLFDLEAYDVPFARSFLCVDCGKDTSTRGAGEYYMVGDELWKAAGMAPNGACSASPASSAASAAR